MKWCNFSGDEAALGPVVEFRVSKAARRAQTAPAGVNPEVQHSTVFIFFIYSLYFIGCIIPFYCFKFFFFIRPNLFCSWHLCCFIIITISCKTPWITQTCMKGAIQVKCDELIISVTEQKSMSEMFLPNGCSVLLLLLHQTCFLCKCARQILFI